MATLNMLKSRVVGSLIGLAVCDAVGTTVEFMPPGSFPPVTGMQGGGPFNLHPGEWTDDTSMALCLAESLVECRGHNPVDQARRYWRWYQEGHLSSNGECFDIGKTVRKALHQFERSSQTEPYPFSTAGRAAGNGSLMRLCPVPLLYHKHPQAAMEMSRDSSRVTHGTKAAVDACSYFAGLIVGALQGVSKDVLLSDHYSPCSDYWKEHPLVPEVDAIAAGSFKRLNPPDIKASGYVVRSLESVLWAFHHTDNFKDGCLKVVNLGDDADTVGAIYGQLAGCYYGSEGIPAEWKEQCSLLPLLELFAEELHDLAGVIPQPEVPIPDPTDWNRINLPVPPEELSERYRNVKLKGYDLLEEKNREIVRKLNPCPKQYKKLEDFEAEVLSVTEQYKALPVGAQNAGILADFEQRWHRSGEKLQLRLSRRRI